MFGKRLTDKFLKVTISTILTIIALITILVISHCIQKVNTQDYLTLKIEGELLMSSFKFVELFAGIGGFRQGLTPLGGECVLASEWDKYASQAYSILYGGEHLHGDVTKVNENDVPDHDLLVFGMPCQAFSVAGKRLGFEDMRGTLYFEAMRIAKAKKPKALWMENVKGLIGHDGGRTLEVMAQAMSDIGYTIDFDVMNSKYFGVPQNRERIFMIAFILMERKE
jgi:DNA (cytosine-5)-methyltransferase 1